MNEFGYSTSEVNDDNMDAEVAPINFICFFCITYCIYTKYLDISLFTTFVLKLEHVYFFSLLMGLKAAG